MIPPITWLTLLSSAPKNEIASETTAPIVFAKSKNAGINNTESS